MGDTLLLGAIAMAAAIIGLFFMHFWRSTRDRFFLLFALAFWAEAASRVYIGLANTMREDTPGAYLIRLVAYGLILVAIIDKNRPRRRS